MAPAIDRNGNPLLARDRHAPMAEGVSRPDRTSVAERYRQRSAVDATTSGLNATVVPRHSAEVRLMQAGR